MDDLSPVPVAVPVVDLETATPLELVHALIGSSCVFLVNHGYPDDVREALLGTAREFYALPEAEKAQVRWPGDGPWRGWQPVYQGGPQALLLERFEVALTSGGRGLPLNEWADSFDFWPAHPAGMSEAWTAAYASLHDLASRMTTMIAQGLGLPAADLPAWTTRQHSNLVVNHYFALPEPPEPGRIRQRAHTDIGGVTLLWADDAPGLQARIGPDGTWVPVTFPRTFRGLPLRQNALLLQAGDLLHVWSRGRIPANDHRVVNPPRDAGPQNARFSSVFFHHPDLSTWVAPALPGEDRADQGVGALDHVLARQQLSATMDAGAAPAS